MNTISEIFLLIDDLVDTNTTDFPISKKVRLLNKAQQDIVNIIMSNDRLQQWDDENWGDLSEGYLNMMDGQQDYNLDQDENFADILYISKVWILETADAIEYREVKRDGKFTPEVVEGTPRRFRQAGKKIIFDPIPSYNKTNGIKVAFGRIPKPIVVTDTTRKPGIPSTFYPLLALYASYDFARAKNLSNRNDVLSEIIKKEKELGIFVARQDNDTAGSFEASKINAV